MPEIRLSCFGLLHIRDILGNLCIKGNSFHMPVASLAGLFRRRLRFFRLAFTHHPPFFGKLTSAHGILLRSVIHLPAMVLDTLERRPSRDDYQTDNHQDNIHHIGSGDPDCRRQDTCQQFAEKPALFVHQLKKCADESQKAQDCPHLHISIGILPIRYDKCHRTEQHERQDIRRPPENIFHHPSQHLSDKAAEAKITDHQKDTHGKGHPYGNLRPYKTGLCVLLFRRFFTPLFFCFSCHHTLPLILAK